ncbi:MAG: apolipoprotein N-acyltransferase [Gammaproteobacteria bacterium]
MLRWNKNVSEGLLCLLSGASTTLAFAPYNYFFLAVLSPALLFNTWINGQPLTAFCYGYLFGLGMFATGVGWLHISINMFGGVNLAGSLLITFLLVAYLAFYPACVGFLGCRFFADSRKIFLLVAIPALWVLGEWCRARVFTGFPWLVLGYSQIDSPAKGLAALFGVYGISWAVVLSSGILVSILHSNSRQRITLVIAFILLWSGSWLLQSKDWTEKSGNDISIALIQGAIPQELKWKRQYRQKSYDQYLALSRPYWGSDLIVWPETAIPAFYQQATDFINKLHNLARSNDTNLLAGIPVMDRKTAAYYNSAVMFNDGISMYHKRHLVPFGEYLPLDSLLRPFLDFLKIPMSDFTPGDQKKPLLSGPDIDVGISICYEDTFGEEIIQAMPDARVLVNISNDAWFGDSIAPYQHLQMARMRAAETGRYMLRATNTGISAVIDEKGRIIRQAEQFKPESLSAEIASFEGASPFVRFGNIPVLLLAALMLLIGILTPHLIGIFQA